METEVERYRRDSSSLEADAWSTIACNLAFFAGYYDTGVVRRMRDTLEFFPSVSMSPDFRQERRKSLNGSGGSRRTRRSSEMDCESKRARRKKTRERSITRKITDKTFRCRPYKLRRKKRNEQSTDVALEFRKDDLAGFGLIPR